MLRVSCTEKHKKQKQMAASIFQEWQLLRTVKVPVVDISRNYVPIVPLPRNKSLKMPDETAGSDGRFFWQLQ